MRSKATASGETSREKLIRSATHLFGERGFDAVSVRDIAHHSQVNSALVGYYFGNKEGLLAEVYTRHCEPLRSERSRLLSEFSSRDEGATLEQILEAFIVPSLNAAQGSDEGRNFSRLRAILSAENSLLLEQLVAQTFDDANRSFIDALCKCLPHLRREDVFWRFHFLLGTIYYTATGPHRIRALSRRKCDPSNPEETKEELIFFAAAGFRAPSSGRQPKARERSTVAKKASPRSQAA